MNRILTASKAMAKAVIQRKIKYLILHVNSVCNARCRMCFSWQGMQERHDAQGPSLDNLQKLATSMAPLPQLTCSGGEPLLRRDLPDILQAFYERAETRFFTVPTNTLRPDLSAALIDAFVEHCPNGFLNLCMPLHGSQEMHNDIIGVPKAFETLRETYAMLQERRKRHPNISCVLNFVMSRFNYEEYRTIIDLALTDFPEAPLGISYCRGITHEPGAGEVPTEEYLAAQTYLAERRRTLSRSNPYTIMFSAIGEQTGEIVASVVRGECKHLHCGAGRNLAVVYDNGAVHPCELLDGIGLPAPCAGETPPPGAVLGNLNDFDFNLKQLLRSQEAQAVLTWLNSHPCVCTWECAIYSKIVHSPRDFASLAKRVVRYIMRRIPPDSHA